MRELKLWLMLAVASGVITVSGGRNGERPADTVAFPIQAFGSGTRWQIA